MRRPKSVRPLLASALFLIAAAATAQGLSTLERVTPGEWQLRELGAGGTTRSVCVRDARMLLQLQHPGAACSRFVVSDEPRTGTITYSCPGTGSGRTTITVESENLFRLQTQGIVRGAPFDLDYEGRRRGACTGASAALVRR